MDVLEVSPDEAAAFVKSVHTIAKSGEAMSQYLVAADNYRRTSIVQLLLILSAIYTICSIVYRIAKRLVKATRRRQHGSPVLYRPLLKECPTESV